MILPHTNLLGIINAKTITINDLHTVLKIKRTLPLIEKYQAVNKSSTKPLEGFADKVNRTLNLADTLANK